MKIRGFLIFFAILLSTVVSAQAETKSEIDDYNNLYYPQSVYNGGINSFDTQSAEAYVNPATGSVHIRATDVVLPGAGGFDLSITRVYNSQNSALYEGYLHEIEESYSVTCYTVRGKKKEYKVYMDNAANETTTENVCLRPEFMKYHNSKNSLWMFGNTSKFEFNYNRELSEEVVFTNAADAQELADYVNSELNEISVTYPYSNVQLVRIDYFEFEVVTADVIKKTIGYSDGLLDYTASERYSKLGIGWEFDFPYIEKRYGYDDREYEYLHFGDKGTYLLDFSPDSPENHLDGYPLNDVKIAYDSSVTHDGIRSEYVAVEKDGTRHWFGADGRLLIKEDRYGNRIKFYCGTDVFADAWGNNRACPYIERIVDTVGREVVFSIVNDSSAKRTLRMSISNPNDAEDVRVWEYSLQKLTSNDTEIFNYSECKPLERDKWVLKSAYDPENRRTNYGYSYMKSKFSFLDRNRAFHTDYADVRDSFKGNSYVDKSNIEKFVGLHNAYALVTSVSISGGKSYTFAYAPFVKNCTPRGSMIFAKAYMSHEEYVEDIDGNSVDMNRKTYLYDINDVGEYDGYISYRYEDRISSGYNYAVKVTDGNVSDNKYSHKIYSYSYVGAERDKTIILAQLDDKGSDHRFVTDYSYDSTLKLPLQIVQTSYDTPDSAVGMTKAVAYTYDSGKYGDVLGETPNGDDDRTVAYTYSANYHFPTSRTYKQAADREIKYEYVPTADGKGVEYINIYENNVLKNKVCYSHDSYGNITSKKEFGDDFLSYTETEYVYQNGANLISETKKNVADNDNITTDVSMTAVYDYWGNPISRTDANGNVTAYEYDLVNRVLKVTNADGSTKNYTHKSLSVKETDEVGNTVQTSYTRARDVKLIRYVTLGVESTRMYYDTFGGLETEIFYSDDVDDDGWQIPLRTVKYSYDTAHRPIAKEVFDRDDALIYRETYSHEITADYQKSTTTIVGDESAQSVVTSEYFDAYGNKIKVENGADFESYTHDYRGNVLTVKSARANSENWSGNAVAAFEYDYADRQTKATDVMGNSTRTEYDTLGRKIKEYDADNYAAEYKYDQLGRLIEQRSPVEEKDGTMYYAVKKMWYDKAGNLIKERVNTNAPGTAEKYNETEYTYDNRNRLVMTKTHDGYKNNYVQNFFDAKGNLLRVYTGLSKPLTINGCDDVTDGGDSEYAVTKYSCDELGRVTQITDALGQSETKTYDNASGLMTASSDRKGQNFVYAYNGLGSLKSKSMADGTNSETRTYDSTGKIHSLQNATSTVTYTYNSKGLPITESDSATGTVKQFEYDSGGNRTVFTLQRNGQAEIRQTYEYDKLNRPVTVRENGNVIASYSFDSKGNRTQTVSGGVTTNYTYNIGNLLIAQTSGDKLTEEYAYYLNGNIKTKTVNGDVTSYRYDGMNRLSNENDTEYFFDDFGNRIAMISDDAAADYEYDLNNRLVKVVEFSDNYDAKTTTMFYDKNGNMVSKAVMTNKRFGENVSGDYTISQNSDGNVALYEYNCYNQLTGVDTRGVMSHYTYSPDGMRASKTVGGNTIAFVYDNSNVVAEITADGINKCLRGVELIKNGDGMHYIINGQGDVSMLLNSDGNVVASYAFDAYGNQLSGGTVENPFGYRGEYADAESGLIYLRARMYDPVTGRFLTEDPAHDGDNWYVYCSNNPIVFVDPLGLFDYNSLLSVGSSGIDVRVLQNELAWLGYYNDKIDGAFGKNTLSAVKAYQQAAGLDVDGIVGVNTWSSMGLNYRSSADVNAGIEIVTWGLKQYKDVTRPIDRALIENVGVFEKNRRNPIWFYKQVKNNSPWDIKRPDSWNATIAVGTYPGSATTPVVYRYMLTSPEGLGNITYGYLGTVAGFSEAELLAGGDAAANGVGIRSLKGIYNGIAGVIKQADSEEDKANIRQGIRWFMK